MVTGMSPSIGQSKQESLMALAADRVSADQGMIFPFTDYTRFLTELLKLSDGQFRRLVAIGQVQPEVAIAADRADTDLVELLPASPFTADAVGAVKEFESAAELVYLANPNRVTGASVSFSELRLLAKATSDGLLIVDEQYADSFEISARPLIDSYANIVVLRPLSSVAGPGFADAGFAVADERLIKRLNAFAAAESLSGDIPFLIKYFNTFTALATDKSQLSLYILFIFAFVIGELSVCPSTIMGFVELFNSSAMSESTIFVFGSSVA